MNPHDTLEAVRGRRWRLVTDDAAPAASGLALDEALTAGQRDGVAPPTLRLYTYRSHCALVGRYQHLASEIDLSACAATGTQVSRRPTGGGAIVMGEGQLGVALCLPERTERRAREFLRTCATGLVTGLAELGVEATFGGKNDLLVAGRKVAGLGLYDDGHGGVLFHASVLADLDVPFMLRVLRIPAAKLADKAVSAVAERVTTVTRLTGTPWTGAGLHEVVATGFAKAFDVTFERGEPTATERARADELVEQRYANHGWLHDRSPQPDATGTAPLKTPEGLVRVHLATYGDLAKSVLFTGDFSQTPEPLLRLEAALRWARLEHATVRRLAVEACPDGSLLGVAPETLADTVMAAAESAGRAAAASTHRAAHPHRVTGSCYFPDRHQEVTA